MSVPCANVQEAGDAVSRSNCSSTLSYDIVAIHGKAWIKTNKKGEIPCIAAQGGFTHVWDNMDRLFPNEIQEQYLARGKRMRNLVRHESGHHFAMGDVDGAFRLWSEFQWAKDVPKPVMNDVLRLIGELWEGERWNPV